MTEGRVAVVVNGNARSVTSEVISTLDQILRKGDLFVSRRIEEAREIAETLVERDYDTVLTGGGDGTFTVMVTEVVRAARASGRPTPRFGLLKLGTGNALACVVGAGPVGRDELSLDIERLKGDLGYREIRLVEVEGILSPFAGLGADAQVLADYYATKEMLQKTPLSPIASGLFGYALSAVTRSLPGYLIKEMGQVRIVNAGEPAFALGTGGRIRETFEPGQVLFEGPARLAGLSTIPYYGFGFRMFPYAMLRPDRMQLRVSQIGSASFVSNLPAIWDGSYENADEIQDFLVQKVLIECSPENDFQIGGDPQGKRTRVEAQITPEPVRLVDYLKR